MTLRSRRVATAVAAIALLLTACSSRIEQAGAPVDEQPPVAASPPAAAQTQAPLASKTDPPAKATAGAKNKPKPTPEPAVDAGPTAAAARNARSARQLATLLLAAESAIRDPGVNGEQLAEAAHAQQLVYRRLTRTPNLRDKVVRLLPRGLRPTARANVLAGASLASLNTAQPKLPDWRIVKPAPAPRLLAHYRTAAAKFGLEWQYLAAINLVETRMGRIRGRSTAGAQGPMQFMPATWDAYGRGDINKPADAIEAAARYLASSGAPQDMRDALWNYNHSDLYVDAVSAYADVMRGDPRAFRGYYYWQVYYRTRDGDVHLQEGYGE